MCDVLRRIRTPFLYAVAAWLVVATLAAEDTSLAVTGGATNLLLAAPSQPMGLWVNVTPANADLTNTLDCDNYGTDTIVADSTRPSDLYTHFDCQGIWKSTDFGQTWSGPINIGTGGAGANGAGGIAIAQGNPGTPPILYSAGIRGTGTGFWRSLDGGVSWTNYNVAPAASGRQDVYPPVVDPYDGNHLIMAAHELNAMYQSTDGGQTWTSVAQHAGMNEPGGTGQVFFINTGDASTTRNTWLWLAQMTGGSVGMWRTTNGGITWTKVDNNEHVHGADQIYQPDTGGVVYVPGVYSNLGWGVLRSTDYGATWVHVGLGGPQTIVFGTPNTVHAMYGWPIGGQGNVDPNIQTAPQQGTTGWTKVSAPAGMFEGPGEAAVVFDGFQYVVITANYQAGLWRYVEPTSGVDTSQPTPMPTDASPTE